MLLTISQPTKAEFGGRNPHDFSPRIPLSTSRYSPKPKVDSPLVTSLQASHNHRMSNPHRGLPPPAAMALPDPNRQPPPPSQPLGAMPEPPRQWQGAEDSMRNWLAAKAEEDKRKQEEEKTNQERLRLEQRRIEQSMLHESMQGGVPPHMVPMIFAGIGGANLANVSLEWLQQYAAQLQAAQQQQVQQQPSPEIRRETRMINPAQPGYAVQQPSQQQPLPSVPVVQSQQPAALAQHQSTFPAYQSETRPAPTSAPRSATHTSLPRLTTNEMHIHQPPAAGPGSAHPLQQSHTIQQDQPASSPSIYFHHWVPPSESKGINPTTPAGRSNEPHSAHPGLSSEGGDYRESPRKRKAQGGHQANPPPSAGPQYTSPSFSEKSSTSRSRGGGHVRSRSSASTKDVESMRPASRRDSVPHSSQVETSKDSEERQSREASQRDERLGRSSMEYERGPPQKQESR